MLKTEAPAGYWRLRNEGMSAAQAFHVAKNAEKVREFWRDHWTGSTLTVELDGVTYTVESENDDISYEDTYDDISPDLEAAFENGYASVVRVRVRCEIDGFTGEDSLGGVECGDYWRQFTLLDNIDQILSTVLSMEMLENARLDALAAKQRAEEKREWRIMNVARVISEELPVAASYVALAEKVITAYEKGKLDQCSE